MHFGQIQPGMVIDGGSRIVSEAEIIEFAERYDPQWIHTDRQRAQRGRWKGLIASGWLTCAIAMELAVRSVMAESESIGSPGIERIRWRRPVRPGDELALRIEVLESRISRSGRLGVVRWRWVLSTGTDAVVLDLIATSLFELKA